MVWTISCCQIILKSLAARTEQRQGTQCVTTQQTLWKNRKQNKSARKQNGESHVATEGSG